MERILIIEDEEKIARFIEWELKYEGYEVEKAFNGRDGLEIAKTQPFDLILLDIMLPGINGMEVLRRIRQFFDIPIIMLTARDAFKAFFCLFIHQHTYPFHCFWHQPVEGRRGDPGYN